MYVIKLKMLSLSISHCNFKQNLVSESIFYCKKSFFCLATNYSFLPVIDWLPEGIDICLKFLILLTSCFKMVVEYFEGKCQTF